MVDDARLRMECDAEVDPLPQIALQVGEEPGDGMCVMPDVRAGAFAAANSLPSVKAAVLEAVTGRSGQGRRVGKGAIEEPVRQGGIVPGVVPETRLLVQRIEIIGHALGHFRRTVKAAGVVTPAVLQSQIGKMPSQNKGHGRGLTGFERKLASQSAD